MKKYKLFTHVDSDGIGCAILARLAFGDSVDIEYCNYNDVDEKVQEFIDSKEDNVLDYEHCFITDISINEEVAEQIDICFNHFTLLDHHKTAEWMNKYKWCKVNVECLDGKDCGTNAFFNYLLLNTNSFRENENLSVNSLKKFVETVRRYDTWEFKTKYNDLEPKQWNDLLYIYGRDKFIAKVLSQLINGYFLFEPTDYTLLELNQEKIDRYIEKKQNEIIEIMIRDNINDYKAGVVYAEQYHSELGNKLAENNPEYDFIVIINMSGSMSFRTVKDIDLGEIAKIYSGGGHKAAAGAPIIDEFKYDVAYMLLDL
jgi:oligoribonuclease NrnB/cAMP/cGMP phosphodiesterase (DHH superfamily)